jgi:hypothetical protein
MKLDIEFAADMVAPLEAFQARIWAKGYTRLTNLD